MSELLVWMIIGIMDSWPYPLWALIALVVYFALRSLIREAKR